MSITNDIVMARQRRYSDYAIISALKRKGATEKEINKAYKSLRKEP